MAKYSRFDPRNKKRGRNKTRSQEKDFRIKESKSEKNYVHSPQDVLEYQYNEGELYDGQFKQGNSY